MSATDVRPATGPGTDGRGAEPPRESTAEPDVDVGNLRLTAAAATATALAAIGLGPVLDGFAWYPPVLLAIAVVAVVGALSRHLHVPLPLHPVLQGLGLVELLLVLVARDEMRWLVLPTGAAAETLRGVMASGVVAIDRSAPPVATSAGIVAVVVLSVGMAALLVDVLAVPLRMPLLAGLPLAALYLVPAVVVRSETPWWCFVPGAFGWLLLLLADSHERLVEWGRVLDRRREVVAAGPGAVASPRNAATTHTPGLSAAARRLGALAVALAVALPFLVPGFTDPVLRGGLGSGPAVLAGGNGGIAINPLVSLKREFLEQSDQVLLTYRTDDPSPDYLRLVSLERFDGQTWSPRELTATNDNEVNGGLPPQIAGLDQQASYPVRRYDVAVDRLDNRYLPLPATTLTVAVGSGWHYDATTRVVFTDDQSTRGASYVATAVDPTWTAARLRALGTAPATAAPGSIDPLLDTSAAPVTLAQTARTVVGARTSPYDQAVALQTWFRTAFRYSTEVVSGNDASYLEQFLRDKVGYCEQFAATMALMARTLGIPARVAVGFTQGASLGDGRWQVTVRDAHAWPELWLQGAGWVRFEPTPRTDAGAGVAVPRYADGTAAPENPAPVPTGAAAGGAGTDKLGADRNNDRRLLGDIAPGGTGPTLDGETGSSPWRAWVMLGLLLVLLVAAAVPGLVRRVRRRRRLHGPHATAESAWAEVRDDVLDHRRPWPESESPRERGAALLRLLEPVGGGEVHAAMARLVLAVERERYARPGAAAPALPGAPPPAGDVAAVRSALGALSDRSGRWRASLWPPTVTDVRLRRARAAAAAGPGGDPAATVGERELASTLVG